MFRCCRGFPIQRNSAAPGNACTPWEELVSQSILPGARCSSRATKAPGSQGSVSPLMAASHVQSCPNENPSYKVPSMAKILSLDELAQIVPDGVRVGIGGVHLSRLPIALIR